MYLRAFTFTLSTLFHASLLLIVSYLFYLPNLDLMKGQTSIAVLLQKQYVEKTDQQADKQIMELPLPKHEKQQNIADPDFKEQFATYRENNSSQESETRHKKDEIKADLSQESEGVDWREAQYKENPAPVYPRRAVLRDVEGDVLLLVYISHEGLPTNVKVEKSSGSQLLDKAAIEAVWKWHFVPAQHEKAFVRSKARIPIHFRINRR